MANSVSVAFSGFWNGFNPEDNFIINTLRRKYDVAVACPEEADVLFCSSMSPDRMRAAASCVKVYFTGENDVPDFNEYDYAISFHHLQFGNRHLRLPLYVAYDAFDVLRSGRIVNLEKDAALNREFCSVVLSSNVAGDPARLRLIDEFAERFPLASGGRYKNNVGGPVSDKMDFISRYRFNLCPENSIVDGYVTEKIVEALAAGTVPVYWGCKDACDEFNPDAFIRVNDFASFADAFDEIEKLASDDGRYYAMLTAPKLKANAFADWEQILLDFLSSAIDARVRYVSRYGLMGALHRKNSISDYVWQNRLARNLFSFLSEKTK